MVLVRGRPLEAEDAREADDHDSSLGVGEQGLRPARSSRAVDPPPVFFAGTDQQLAGSTEELESRRLRFDGDEPIACRIVDRSQEPFAEEKGRPAPLPTAEDFLPRSCASVGPFKRLARLVDRQQLVAGRHHGGQPGRIEERVFGKALGRADSETETPEQDRAANGNDRVSPDDSRSGPTPNSKSRTKTRRRECTTAAARSRCRTAGRRSATSRRSSKSS